MLSLGLANAWERMRALNLLEFLLDDVEFAYFFIVFYLVIFEPLCFSVFETPSLSCSNLSPIVKFVLSCGFILFIRLFVGRVGEELARHILQINLAGLVRGLRRSRELIAGMLSKEQLHDNMSRMRMRFFSIQFSQDADSVPTYINFPIVFVYPLSLFMTLHLMSGGDGTESAEEDFNCMVGRSSEMEVSIVMVWRDFTFRRWFAKRFLHPDVVAQYDHIFLWDEILELKFSRWKDLAAFLIRYLSIIKEEGLQISQPAIDADKSEVHYKLTARETSSKVHRRAINLRGPGRRCYENSMEPPCTGFVEMMAPVFSRHHGVVHGT
ncbi:hypothetical protein Sango_2927700 [Sesamum angolense]|uniref:Uncharacterized protein n=1 Tax=Sesamum angolense TaxID=2727404 RepID=A0AAE1T5I3_9LAMI|nr:hypothetical protein Sango_2927700 [Sesamum angolense]